MKDDADQVDRIAIDKLITLATKRYELGRERFGITDLSKDPRQFLEEGVEELIDLAWYLAARLVQLRMLEEKLNAKEKERGAE